MLTFQLGEAVLLHEEVGLLPHALQFSLLGLLYRMHLAVLLGSPPENCGEVASTDMLQLAELIDTLHRLLLGRGFPF
jgi:hypothetical protein